MSWTQRNATGLRADIMTAGDRQPFYVLHLYVGGASPQSLAAISNVKRMCDEALTGRYALNIVDIYQQPDRARFDKVVAVPTLVKQQPLPLRRCIGSLANRRRVLRAFGVVNAEG